MKLVGILVRDASGISCSRRRLRSEGERSSIGCSVLSLRSLSSTIQGVLDGFRSCLLDLLWVRDDALACLGLLRPITDPEEVGSREDD